MKNINLKEYVRRRNGAALGAKGSLKNMLRRSLGAGKFSGFWHYWNPIWGYYLGKYIFKPLRNYFSKTAAIFLTFLISGLIHDLVVSVIYFKIVVIVTPWFVLMSFGLILSNKMGVYVKSTNWYYRALINISYIGICLFIALKFREMYA